MPNDADRRVGLEGVNRLIAEIDDEALTSRSPLASVLTVAGGDGDETGMGGNVQCKGKDVFVAEVNTSDSICKICSFIKIGFPKANWNQIDDGYRLPFFLKKGVGPQIQNDVARASELTTIALLNYNHRLLREQLSCVDTILNVEDFEIET